ncbi:MAG: biotin--[acetyl-CoA-carboxylase] ligase [Alphaproteobacteria bacterium]|nr:biotin--[acetyl-CoA-carboxylase] ligase [Alphaproteobacteria bacterium]
MSVHWLIETYETLTSTQDMIRDRLGENPPEGLVVQAIQQTRGRGRQGRSWFSPPGNLYLSVLLKPVNGLCGIGQLSLVSCLSLSNTLAEMYGLDQKLLLKWPNDILLEGRKCAGILLETETDEKGAFKGVILGMGVNVVSAPPEMGTALQASTDRKVALADLREALLERLEEDYQRWQKQGFTPFRSEWVSKTVGSGTPLSIGHGKTSRAGTFEDIDPEGSLILAEPGGNRITVSSGEVFFM